MLSASTLNVTRLRVAPDPMRRTDLTNGEALDLLRTLAFQPIDTTTDEQSVGWCAWHDLTDTEWKHIHPDIGLYMAFALRIDQRKVAPAILKKEIALAMKEEEARSLKEGKPYITRERKAEIKSHVKARLLARTMPTPKSIGAMWDTASDTVYFLSTQDKEIELFCELFTSTFGLELQEPDFDHEKVAPSQFLAWLWFNSARTGGHIGNGLTISKGDKVTLSGATASVSAVESEDEARLALRLGKTVSSMSVQIQHEVDGISCACTLGGQIARLSGIKGLPKGADAEDADAAFLEQVYCLEKLFAYVDHAYSKHLATLADCEKPLARWCMGVEEASFDEAPALKSA